MRSSILASLSACTLLASVLSTSHDARACGGCFHPVDQPVEQSSVVTAHRMALSVSTHQTVLWDQVEYAGSPDEFVWVLPIKPGARVEVGSDAWFESLDAATGVRTNAPELACPEYGGFSCTPVPVGCGADSSDTALLAPPAEPDPVTVVHRGSAGPYETVTLHSDVPGALNTWLSDNSFAVDPSIQPTIDAYAADGFDFIVLRLLPDAGVQQMRPVRVVMPGAVYTLPLRMVAAGTGASVALTLFVIGEGRWAPSNFPEATVLPSSLTWDFNLQASTYAAARDAALAQNGGRSWLTTYAREGALLVPQLNPVSGVAVQYVTQSAVADTIGEAFVQQARSNGETFSDLCVPELRALGSSNQLVVDTCIHGGEEDGQCGKVEDGQIDARHLACPAPSEGEPALDDLAVALTGMHPADVWLTRLEANLPRAALSDDLELSASPHQTTVENWIVAEGGLNEPCPLAAAPPRRDQKDGRNALAALFMGLGLSVAVGRRLGRSSPALSRGRTP